MAMIIPRGNRHKAVIRLKGHPTTSKTFDTLAEAETWARQTEATILGGDERDMTLHRALGRYAEEVTPHKRGHRQELVRILWWQRQPLAERRLTDIRSTDIVAWRDAQARRLAPSTIRNLATILSTTFKVARSEWGLDDLVNPVAGVRMPKHRPGRERRLALGEEERLIRASWTYGAPWMEAAIVLALETSLRLGEMLALEWPDIFEDRLLVRRGKNGRPRTVALSTRARTALAELPRSVNGKVITLSSTEHRYLWINIRNSAGCPDLRWHDLRHEAVSRLFERGLSTEEVMSMSGHRTYSQLLRYTHLQASSLAAKLG